MINYVQLQKTLFMFLVTIYSQSPGKRKRNRHLEFATIQQAVDYGQNSVKLYDIFDTTSFRIIDWLEINMKIDDGWVYNEDESLWEKNQNDDQDEI